MIHKNRYIVFFVNILAHVPSLQQFQSRSKLRGIRPKRLTHEKAAEMCDISRTSLHKLLKPLKQEKANAKTEARAKDEAEALREVIRNEAAKAFQKAKAAALDAPEKAKEKESNSTDTEESSKEKASKKAQPKNTSTATDSDSEDDHIPLMELNKRKKPTQ